MRKIACLVGTLTTVALAMYALAGDTAKKPAEPKRNTAADVPKEVSLPVARREVRMLDDIYKLAIVLITQKYVHNETDFPAGAAAVQWFDAIGKRGWHKVRLIDVSGEPADEGNLPQDEFEKLAVKLLRQGKSYVERVEKRGGKRFYRAATPVPVVLPKCVMCHDNYKNVKPGQPVGALVYTIPLRSPAPKQKQQK